MKKLQKNKIKFKLNYISKSVFLVSIVIFIYNSFKLNYYEILFIDERLLIDDIYNVWLIDDVYKNFQNIENKLLRSVLIILYEVTYGGDLRYGRLWSNFYILFSGPFTLINNNYLITFTRILNICLFVITVNLISKTFINKKYHWIFLLSCLSIPGLEYLIRIPKPEIFSIFLISIGLYFFKNEKFYLSFLFFGLATFIKINFLLFYFMIFLYVFNKSDHKFKLIFKSIFITFCAMFIVNPILIIPPLKIFQSKLPNFYIEYFKWLSSQGLAGQSELYSSEYFMSWLKSITSFYMLPQGFNSIFPTLLILFVGYLFYHSIKSDKKLTIVFLSTLTFYLIFYFFFIERQFLHYLTFPFLLIMISIFINIEAIISIKKIKPILISFVFLIITFGTYSNLEQNFQNKIFITPNNLGYENISNQNDVKSLIGEVVQKIDMIIKDNDNQNTYDVYWNPNLYIPRNGVTYFNKFYVRESWDNDNLSMILEKADFYVTNQEFEQPNIIRFKVKNLYIYHNG